MKYLIFLILFVSMSCGEPETEATLDDVKKILYHSQVAIKGDTFDIVKVSYFCQTITLDNKQEYSISYIDSRLIIDSTKQEIKEILEKLK